MQHLRPALVVALFAVLTLAGRATAQEPPGYTFAPAPPGTIVQSRLLYLAGDAMHSQWRAVASKRLVGAGNGTKFYQWYLSIYAIDGATYRLKYQSPRDGGPLSNVTKANGAQLWFPIQTLKIDAPVQLMGEAIDQLVVESHEMSADCGSGTVAVFTTNSAGSVVPAVSASNGCELTAAPAATNALTLSGPYYAADAAMCCPTKPKANATLRYKNGKWVETPAYYQLFPGKLPPQ